MSEALDTLEKSITDIQKKITDTNRQISDLQQNSTFLSQQKYITDNNITDVNTQAGNLNFPGNVIAGTHILSTGVTQYQSTLKQIHDLAAKLADLQNNQLPVAQKAFDDLNKQELANPTLQATIAAQKAANDQALAKTNYAATTTKYYIIAGVVVVVAIIGVVIYFKNKK